MKTKVSANAENGQKSENLLGCRRRRAGDSSVMLPGSSKKNDKVQQMQ
ncbi:hypothetical protein [Stenotrophomonas humi]